MEKFVIIETNSQYGALTAMINTFEHYLRQNTNYEIIRINILTDNGRTLISNILPTNPEYIFMTQGVLFNFQSDNGDYVMQKLHSKILGWIVDPPFYHSERIKHMTSSMKLACVDNYDTLYAKKFYKCNAETLHLFGVTNNTEYLIPICERPIEIFAPGSYKSIKKFDQTTIANLPTGFQVLVKNAVGLMLQDENLLVVDALNQSLLSLQINSTIEEMEEYMKYLGTIIDTYCRNLKRGYCIASFLKQGMSITVCGKGWDDFANEFETYNRLNILSENMPYDEMLDTMRNSQIVLNSSPFFKEGIHDRVSAAMLAGAVCVTDVSEALLSLFVDEETILYYNWNDLDNSIASIINTLQDKEKLQKIADTAINIAKEKLSVNSFAKNVLKIFES